MSFSERTIVGEAGAGQQAVPLTKNSRTGIKVLIMRIYYSKIEQIKEEETRKQKPYSNGKSIRSSVRGASLLRMIIRAQAFQRKSASSFPAGRIASAFS